MSWLFNSMEPNVAEGFLFLNITKEIWCSVAEIYNGKENMTKHFKLQVDINKIAKDDKPFHTYINHLKSMWDRFHQYHHLTIDLKIIKRR